MRTFLAVLAGLAVIYFGVTGRGATEQGQGLSGGVVLLAVAASLLVWYLTRPGDKAAK
ncbi:amidophosphoribosyltransferase [Micromonospora sp. NPDC000089]|uniref:amidophosphoribosyltransferase n=1 Tax=unclassified Micromonospora TaxID=2617518 RepID=UPI003678BB90